MIFYAHINENFRDIHFDGCVSVYCEATARSSCVAPEQIISDIKQLELFFLEFSSIISVIENRRCQQRVPW